ncbi:MAG: TetR/AcrR family transcriptional regulator [Polyangiales bacterium]
MGRKSLATERRAQCLDAFEECLVEHGYAGATLERVAERAGVHRTIIRHYFGGRDELVDALLARLRSRYAERYLYDDAGESPDETLAKVLDAIFVPFTSGAPTMDRVFDALYATATSDPRVLEFLRTFYRDATERLEERIASAHPHASRAELRTVTAGILALGVGHSILDTIEPVRERAKRLRVAADALLATLRAGPSAPRSAPARRRARARLPSS